VEATATTSANSGGREGHHGGHRGHVNRRTAVVNGRGHEIRESVKTHVEAAATTSVNSGGREGHHRGHRGRVNRRTAGTYDQQQQHRISAVSSGQGQCPEEQHRLQQEPGMYHQLYQDCLNSELRGITNTKTNMGSVHMCVRNCREKISKPCMTLVQVLVL
jgi:hypothetical protein